MLPARLVVADDADEIRVDVPLALAVGGRGLLLLKEDGTRYNDLSKGGN